MRSLPSAAITDDIEEEGKVHEIDTAEIRQTVAEEWIEGQESGDLKKDQPGPPGWKPVKQQFVDPILVSALQAVVCGELTKMDIGEEPSLHVRHLWFPENDIRRYELRNGNPPGRSGRPKWLRGLDLVIDPIRGPHRRILNEIADDKARNAVYAATVFHGVEASVAQRKAQKAAEAFPIFSPEGELLNGSQDS